VRSLGIDFGFSLGYGFLAAGANPASGSRRIEGDSIHMGCAGRCVDRVVRELILEFRPDIIAFATPFIGRVGKVTPTQLRPIMSFPTIGEMVCHELRIRCVEWDEPAARRAFVGDGNLPGKSEMIKAAIQQECRDRNWPCRDSHAGDALCIADYTLAQLDPDYAHTTTALFQAKRPKR